MKTIEHCRPTAGQLRLTQVYNRSNDTDLLHKQCQMFPETLGAGKVRNEHP